MNVDEYGISRLRDLDPAEPVRRYERESPGELIHIDIKKLGRFHRVGHRITGDRRGQSKSRGIGWEFVHVAIDDASRLAFSQILPDERKESAVAFLRAAGVQQSLPRPSHPAHPHKALQAEDQRQGRTLL